MLEKVKLALRLSTDALDDEVKDLIDAAEADLGIVGVKNAPEDDALVRRAVVTYCRLHFGEPTDPERLQRSYDEQKAQLITATGYGLPADETPPEKTEETAEE